MIQDHSMIGVIRLLPAVLYTTNGGISTTSWTVTPPVAPTAGNLLIIVRGGVQSTTPTLPAGWTEFASGIFRNRFFYKVATSSEPSSYSWTESSTLGGGYKYFEIANVDDITLVNNLSVTSAGAVATISPGSYDLDAPSISITSLALPTSDNTWGTDNGFTNYGTSGSFKVEYKITPDVKNSVTVNWSGTSRSTITKLITLRGKIIR